MGFGDRKTSITDHSVVNKNKISTAMTKGNDNLTLSHAKVGNLNNSSTNITNRTTTDHGLVDKAARIATDAQKSAGQTTKIAVLENSKINDRSISAITNASRDANKLTKSALNSAVKSASDFARLSDKSAGRVAKQVSENSREHTKAMYDAAAAVINQAEKATNKVSAAYAGANRSILASADKSVATATRAMDTMKSMTNQTVSGWLSLINGSTDRIDSQVDKTMSFVAANNAQTINAIQSATKSEGERTNDTLIKVAMGAAVLMVGAVMWGLRK